MKKVLGLLLIAAVLVLSSCQARVTDTNTTKYESGVQSQVARFGYFQDDIGEVFALVVIKTGMNAQEDGVGLAHIDKADVTLAMKAKIKNYKE